MLPADALIFALILPILREAGARWEAERSARRSTGWPRPSVLCGCCAPCRPRHRTTDCVRDARRERPISVAVAAVPRPCAADHLSRPGARGRRGARPSLSIDARLSATMAIDPVREFAPAQLRPDAGVGWGARSPRRELSRPIRRLDTLEQFPADRARAHYFYLSSPFPDRNRPRAASAVQIDAVVPDRSRHVCGLRQANPRAADAPRRGSTFASTACRRNEGARCSLHSSVWSADPEAHAIDFWSPVPVRRSASRGPYRCGFHEHRFGVSARYPGYRSRGIAAAVGRLSARLVRRASNASSRSPAALRQLLADMMLGQSSANPAMGIRCTATSHALPGDLIRDMHRVQILEGEDRPIDDLCESPDYK